MMNFNELHIVTVAPNDAATTTRTLAAGTTAVNSVSVDAIGDFSANFVIGLGAITATGTGTIKLQRSDDGSTWADITGASQAYTDADANKNITICISEVVNRYLRVVTTRATANSAIGGMFCFLEPRSVPVTQVTTGIQNAHQPIVVSRSSI